MKNESLRDRKRHQTRQALERAAVKLVSENGLDKTTIEAISSQANVSPRTFFNYFDTKEDALLGLHDVVISDEIIAACLKHRVDNNLKVAVTTLIMHIIEPSLTNHSIFKQRRQLIQQHPQLLERQVNRMSLVSRQLNKAVRQIADELGQTKLSETDAEILLALCSSGVRVVIRAWISSGKTIDATKMKKQAIQTINEVINKIND